LSPSSGLKLETVCVSETLVSCYEFAWHHVPGTTSAEAVRLKMDSDVEDSTMCRMCMCEDDVILYSIFDDVSTADKIWECVGLKVIFITSVLAFVQLPDVCFRYKM
jgi:hypothetical protein